MRGKDTAIFLGVNHMTKKLNLFSGIIDRKWTY